MTTLRQGMAVGWCIAMSLAALAGCGVEKSRNPLSPSIAGPIEGVMISAPTPVMLDAGLIRVTDQPITLQFNAATSDSERPFWYEIEVSTSNAFDSLVHEARPVEPSGDATESYQMPALDPEQQYVWRVRALDGANTGPYSEVATFEVYTPVAVGRPEPVSPVGAASVDGLTATLTVRNARVTGPARNVRYEFQWATDVSLSQGLATATVPAGDASTSTTIRDLEYETRYYWRGRALADGREPDPVAGAWSQTESFMSPPRVVVPPPMPPPKPGPTTAPGRGDCCPPPNRFTVVQAIVNATGNLYRDDIHQFTQRVAECLAAEDGDWGRRLNDSGAVGKDTVAYRTSKGHGDGPYSIDIMRGAEGSDPTPHWSIQSHDGIEGRVGGSWIAMNGANCILAR